MKGGSWAKKNTKKMFLLSVHIPPFKSHPLENKYSERFSYQTENEKVEIHLKQIFNYQKKKKPKEMKN